MSQRINSSPFIWSSYSISNKHIPISLKISRSTSAGQDISVSMGFLSKLLPAQQNLLFTVGIYFNSSLSTY